MYTKFDNFYHFNLLATNNMGLQSLWLPSDPTPFTMVQVPRILSTGMQGITP